MFKRTFQRRNLKRSNRPKRRRQVSSRQLRFEQLEERRVLTSVLPTFAKAFETDTIGPGSVSTLTFMITNPDATPDTDLAFYDTLPTGVTIADPAGIQVSNLIGEDLVVSAPDGGSTITLSGGELGGFTTGTISVGVTSSMAGVHTNTTGDLTSNHGNSGTATADLTVATDRPGFSMAFADASIQLGERTTLTYTVDNSLNGSQASSLAFTHDLPTGLEVAGPSNATHDCIDGFFTGGVLTAVPGSSTISLGSGGDLDVAAVGAGAICSISVDVIATGVGMLDTTSGELTSIVSSSPLSSGKAAASLEVTRDVVQADLDFPDDPVPPGAMTTLDIAITNFDRDFTATDVALTIDLGAALTGLTFDSINSNGLGGSLTGVGTTVLELSGGTLAAGATEVISVELSVPGAAVPGEYIVTTSSTTAMIDGSPETSDPVTETLFVEAIPLLTMEFLEVGTLDPNPVVGAGGDVVIRYTVTNTSTTSGATDIAFIDELTDGSGDTPPDTTSGFLPFPVSVTLPPTPDPPLGGGSSLALVSVGTDRQGLSLTGGSLAAAPGAGSTGSFDVTVTIPEGLAPGTYTSFTEQIMATVDGTTAVGFPASDDLQVVAAPDLLIEFTDPVLPGDSTSLEFTLTNPNDDEMATDIGFTLDLAALAPAVPGLVATGLPVGPVIGGGTMTGSAGDTLLTFSGGSLAAGATDSFSVNLDVPSDAPPGAHTATTSSVTATVAGVTATGNMASDDLDIVVLTLEHEFTDPVVAGQTTTLTYTLENLSPDEDATDISFSHDLDSVISGMQYVSGPTPAMPLGGSLLFGPPTSTVFFSGGTLAAGAMESFSVEVEIPAGADPDLYTSTTGAPTFTFDGSTVFGPPSTSTLEVVEAVSVSKNFLPDTVAPGDTTILEYTIINNLPDFSLSNIIFTDDLDDVISGLDAINTPVNQNGFQVVTDGSGLLTITGSLAADGSATFQVELQVPDPPLTAGTFTSTTSNITGDVDGEGLSFDVEGASDNITVSALPDFGDAPNGYGTRLASDGARHLPGGPKLGALRDFEADVTNPLDGTSDDNTGLDDEDGVFFVDPLLPGTTGDIEVVSSGAAELDFFLDWNLSGTFGDVANEVYSTTLVAGTNVIPVAVPAGAAVSGVFARFRISNDGGLGPFGEAPDGEVEDYALGNPFVVTNTNDSGLGSLRRAIDTANANPGTDTISFNIPGTGPQTITPLDELPAITDAVIIDAKSEPDFVDTPVVVLAGSAAGQGAIGLRVLAAAGPSTIQGLVINHWDNTGIFITGSDGHTVDGNFIGTDVTGMTASPNGTGIKINQSSNNMIGTPAMGNLISGNEAAGIRVSNAASTGNMIQNNLIGTNITGNAALANDIGVQIATAQSNTIGGTGAGEGNIISGNTTGVLLRGDSNDVQGNRIGTNLAGTAAIANEIGVEISLASGNTVGGTDAGAGNQISGNTDAGVLLTGNGATGNFVQGNLIGTNAAGDGSLGNREGVLIADAPSNTIGGTADNAGNLISGNTKNGVHIRNAGATGNVVQENQIGTNLAGDAAVANGRGILIDGAANNQIGGSGNVISGNVAEGIRIQNAGSTGNSIRDNLIGTNAAGDMAVPNLIGVRIRNLASNNTIGGDSTADEGNVISGNTFDGVTIHNADSNTIQGNLIGLNSAGTAGLGNGSDGVEIRSSMSTMVGGGGTGQGNVISGNTDFGVRLRSGSSNTVSGNRIGTDQAGTSSIANPVGVLIESSGNTIGGDSTAGEGNQISGNTEEGVLVTGTGNFVQGNLIGLNAAGTGALGNENGVRILNTSGNTIGGDSTAGEGNVISGNQKQGVWLEGPATTNTSVAGNRIGTNQAGTGAVANGSHGVLVDSAIGNTIGGTAAGAGNLISGNTFDGVRINGAAATNNMLLGNTIGTNAAGPSAVPNRSGVVIGGSAGGNSIGDGTAAGSNEISGNNQRGVWIQGTAGTDNTISQNSIHNNAGLGIAINGPGVQANDAGDPDAGPNNLQNFPVISSVVLNGANLDVEFLVDSAVANSAYDLTIEFFIADADDQEGETFLDQVTYTEADAGLTVQESIAAGTAGIGSMIVATATDAAGNTSEFSAPVTVAANLLAAGGAADEPVAEELSAEELAVAFQSAIERFVAVGLDEQLFASVSYSIADLPGSTLGRADRSSIVIDSNAAGHGWFIDSTPLDDSEFFASELSNQKSKIENRNAIDLLTVVMHELGHTLGLSDDYSDPAADHIMNGWLPTGTRRLPTAADLDGLFADEHALEKLLG